MNGRIPAIVSRIEAVCDNIKSFYFAPETGGPLPGFSAGAHIALDIVGPGRRWRNAYSLTSSPDDRRHYRITVLRKPDGRGGSRYLHDQLQVGHRLSILPPVNWFGIDRTARLSLLVAGGIGITPIAAMASELRALERPFEFHYAYRAASAAAFLPELRSEHGEALRTYCQADGQMLSLSNLLASRPVGTQVLVCGPQSLIDAVREAAARLGWPPSAVRYEKFAAATGGAPFEASLVRSGIKVSVPADLSLLEAIEGRGIAVDSLCRVGACGRCRVDVVRSEGEFTHADRVLTETEKAAGNSMLCCVSRFSGSVLELDL